MISSAVTMRTRHARSASRGSMCTPRPLRRAVHCKSAIPTERDVGNVKNVGVDMMSLPGMAKYFFDNDLDLSELHKKHGSAFVINFGMVMGGWNLAVSDVESIKDVLNSSDKRFFSSWPDEYIRLFSPWGRVARPEEQAPWKRIMLRILSQENVMSLQLPLMVDDITQRVKNHASSGEEILWLLEGRRIAFGVAARASMGSLITDAEMETFFELFNKVSISGDSGFGLRDGLPGTRFWSAVRARKQIEALVYPKVKAALEDPSMLDGETSAVTRLLEALQAEEGIHSHWNIEAMSTYIASNAFFLMFAGTDTTSNSLLRMAVLLNRHPEWFQRLQEEQDRLKREFGDTIDRKVLSRSAVAAAFAHEILRMKVPVRTAFRTATSDTVVGGVRVPKGTALALNLQTPVYETGTPEFNPGQWLNSDQTRARPNDARGNMVWGAGPRRCAGQNLATVEIITCLVILAREVQRFDSPPEKNDHDYFANQKHPTGFPVTLIPRA